MSASRRVRVAAGVSGATMFNRLFRVECGWPGVGRGLRVEVEVLDDERTSTPAVVKDLGRCLTLPAAAPCPRTSSTRWAPSTLA